jgi:predicted metal-dependent peptidase
MDSKIIERTIFSLIEKLPYYGHLVQTFKIVLSNAVPTAGVCFDENGKSIRMAINPEYFESLTETERVALLIHECSHVDRLHLIRGKDYEDKTRFNIAADLAINSYIEGLPAGALYAQNYRLRNLQTAEWYYDRVDDEKRQKKDDKESGKNDSEHETEPSETSTSGNAGEKSSETSDGEIAKKYLPQSAIDVHEWDSAGLSESQQAEIVENSIKRAMEKAGSGADILPSHVQETLRHLKDLKTKKWHKELKKFLGKTVNGWDRERTWSRRNRRFGLAEAGSKIAGQKKLAIAFDTSGSMSEKELNQALAEAMAMVKGGVTGYLIQFDCAVNKVEKLRRNQEVEIVGRGGTSFSDLMKKVDELHCDGLVVFTDGDDSDICVKPKTPVLWVYTAGHKDKYEWGFKTELT